MVLLLSEVKTTLMCLNIWASKIINFPFGKKRKLMVSDVPKLNVYEYTSMIFCIIFTKGNNFCDFLFSFLNNAAWAQGYKTFSMLNSAEHIILPANKQQITDNKYNLLSLAE